MSHPAVAAGYSGTPLPRKLGIKPEHRVVLVAAPAGFDLGPLPAGVTVARVYPDERGEPPAGDVTLAFCRDQATLLRWFGPLKIGLAPAACLWIAWPKKAANVATDIDETFVREYGLSGGLVDVKVCAVDRTWSGLKFVYRVADRAKLSGKRA